MGVSIPCVAAAVAALATIVPVVANAASLPAGVIAVPLSRDEGLTAYYAKVEVGTPFQTEFLKIDTGSPRYSFLNPRNEVCHRSGNSCSTFGTFNNETSSTCQYEGPGFTDALGPVGGGDYLSDTVKIGGVSTKDMYFGYTTSYSFPNRVLGDVNTILGLSLECQFAGPKCTDKFSAYMLPELKNASKIDYLASSIYLGPDDKEASNAQMLLGGAYDKAKIEGELMTLPMVDPFDLELSGGQTNSVNVSSVEVYVSKDSNLTTETYGDAGVGVPVLLDTGVANWYLTEKTMAPIYRAFGVTEAPPAGQRYFVVDCKYANPARTDGHVSVEFGGHGKIVIPFQGLVSKFPDGTCGVFASSRGDTVSTFGDPFLRNVYSIFDQENFSISLGKVRHTAEENIQPLPKGGFKATHG
ncbi:eukaryotic aspartyl protease domain-containing protein [Sarocladium implicatum]|nr:eukaryotic aspartyl protease domain-containing protein [Sarocladium implicatum]